MALLLAAGLAAALVPQRASAQTAVKGKIGAWETRCETPPGSQSQQCAIVQSVVDDDRPNITLVVIALKTADRKSRLLRVIAPLGVLLPTGIGLRVETEDLGRMNFMRCQPNGCIAEVFLDEKILGKLEAATKATLVLYQTMEEGIGVPVTLTGFKESFEALP